MEHVVRRLAIIGQGLIGSSITRAASAFGVAAQIAVTDLSPRVRSKVIEFGLGDSEVLPNNTAVVRDADLIVICVPVGQIAAVAQEIEPYIKDGAIVTDVGSVKGPVVRDVVAHIPPGAHFVPAHPLAGTEKSGPESGFANLFSNQWCILTPPEGESPSAIDKVKAFWQAIGSHVEIMTPKHHDYVLAITSHVPHLIAFTIFHTALRHERVTESEVMKFSAGGFRDFTRIASSNPAMWRDIFLYNKDAIIDVLLEFNADLSFLAEIIRKEDGEKIFDQLSKSRLARRRVIEKEHISIKAKAKNRLRKGLSRPYSLDD
jgi:cyclohexadieny/prephenate dehydrogenase